MSEYEIGVPRAAGEIHWLAFFVFFSQPQVKCNKSNTNYLLKQILQNYVPPQKEEICTLFTLSAPYRKNRIE